MFILKTLVDQFSFDSLTKNTQDHTDSHNLNTFNFKVRLISWFILAVYALSQMFIGNDLSKPLQLILVPMSALYLYFLFKGNHDFLLALLHLATSAILSFRVLKTEGCCYLSMLTDSLGFAALYLVQNYPCPLPLIMMILYFGLQHFYTYKISELYEPITDSYRIPAADVQGALKGWSLSFIFGILSVMIWQTMMRKILSKFKETKQILDTTNEEIKEMKSKLVGSVEHLDILNKQLEMALNSQDLFISCVSHELRNPLNGMLGSIDLLEPEVKDEYLARILVKCRVCGEALLTQVNNLLDVAKINAAKLDINEVLVKMSTFLASYWPSIKSKVESKGLTACLTIDKNLPLWLQLDASRVQQILDNLINNALKFTATGSIRIMLAWERRKTQPVSESKNETSSYTFENIDEEEEDCGANASSEVDEKLEGTQSLYGHLHPHSMSRLGDVISIKSHQNIEDVLESSLKTEAVSEDGFLKIEVIDTGCGIIEEAQGKIFQPFVQADGSVTRSYGGSGLGLYIVKELVEKMNGSIKMNSLKDLGSSFQILLPIKKVDALQEMRLVRNKRIASDGDAYNKFKRTPHPKIDRAGTDIELLPLAKNKVLVIDDDKFNQNIIKSFLVKFGFEADTADNGLEGVKMYQRDPWRYRFIIMDIQMPMMDGITASKEIRRIEKVKGRESIPIVFVTGNCSEDEQKECLYDKEIGTSYFFRKPFRLSDCQTCVETIATIPTTDAPTIRG